MKWDELTEEQKDAIIEATANAVGGAYDCMRVWSAWSYGTMSEDDFLPVTDSSERLIDIARAVVESLPSPATQTVPWEPRKEWPTPEQIRAWNALHGRWYIPLCGLYLILLPEHSDGVMGYTGEGEEIDKQWLATVTDLAILPLRHGRPTSWTDVDAAVAAMEVKDA